MKKLIGALFCVMILVLVSVSLAGGPGDHYITTHEIRGVAVWQNKILFATAGGLAMCDTNMVWQDRIDRIRFGGNFPSNQLRDIAVDSKGKAWVISEMTLTEIENFGGSESWKNYYSSSLTFGSYPLQLAIDKKDNVWIAHYYGISVFDGKENWKNYKWENLPNISGVNFPQNVVYEIDFDDSGNVWAFSNKGLFFLDKQTDQWEGAQYPDTNFSCSSNGANVACLSKDTLILTSLEKGVYFFFPDKKIWEKIKEGKYYNVQKSSDGRVWLNNWDSSFVWENNSFSETIGFRQRYNNDLESLPGGKIVAVNYNGVYFYNNSVITGPFVIKESGKLPDNRIGKIVIDKEGKAWIQGWSASFIKVFDKIKDVWKDKADFGVDGITSATVKDMATADNGDFWLCTSKEVAWFNGSSWTKAESVKGNCLFLEKNNVWVGSDSGKIHCYSDGIWKNFQSPYGNDNNSSFSSVVASENELYAYCSGYILRRSVIGNDTIFKKYPSYGYNFLKIGKSGELWTVGYAGIYVLNDNDTWTFYPKKLNGLKGSIVNCLEISPLGDVYIGTDSGVYIKKINDKVWKKDENITISQQINCITFDQVNKLIWYGGEGISVYKQDQVTQTVVSTAKMKDIDFQFRKSCISFNLSSGQNVSLEIFDLKGRLIKNLSGYKKAGSCLIELSGIVAGNYVCRVRTGSAGISKKIIITK